MCHIRWVPYQRYDVQLLLLWTPLATRDLDLDLDLDLDVGVAGLWASWDENRGSLRQTRVFEAANQTKRSDWTDAMLPVSHRKYFDQRKCDPTSRNESHGYFLRYWDFCSSIDFALKWCRNYQNRSTGFEIMTMSLTPKSVIVRNRQIRLSSYISLMEGYLIVLNTY